MTPEQALKLLFALSETAPAPKIDHIKAEQAFNILQAVLAPKPEVKDDDCEKKETA